MTYSRGSPRRTPCYTFTRRALRLLRLLIFARLSFKTGTYKKYFLLKKKRYFAVSVTALAGLLSLPAVTLAASFAQGYQTGDTDLKEGMTVVLSRNSGPDSLLVEAADSSSELPPLGVVVKMSNALLAVGSSTNNVFIAENGPANAYVSDLNGAAKRGDLLSLSPVKGVLQKTDASSRFSVGTVLEDFSEENVQTGEVKDRDGKLTTVKMTLTSINIDIKPVSKASGEDTWLGDLGYSLTGRNVNEVRVLMALVVFLVLLAVESAIVHGTVTSTIAAAGRNPLARMVIERQSLRGVIIAMMVLLVGLAAIGVILWA